MSRSLKKGPYVDEKLMKKVMAQKNLDSPRGEAGKKEPIKTWARACQIAPEFVGHTFLVHQGKTFISVYVSESMVGHRLGEFAPTRTFRGHGKVSTRSVAKT